PTGALAAAGRPPRSAPTRTEPHLAEGIGSVVTLHSANDVRSTTATRPLHGEAPRRIFDYADHGWTASTTWEGCTGSGGSPSRAPNCPTTSGGSLGSSPSRFSLAWKVWAR